MLIHLGCFGFSYVTAVDSANRLPLSMNLKHDLCRFFCRHMEKLYQYVDDELHRSIIIVEQNHLIKRWPRHFRPAAKRSGPLLALTIIVTGLVLGTYHARPDNV